MAIQDRVDIFEIEGVSVTVRLDAGAPTGAHTQAEISGEGWTVNRTWRFGSYSRAHCRNFARKLATDAAYRQRCLGREATWAQVEDIYRRHREDVLAVFEPLASGPPAAEEEGELDRETDGAPGRLGGRAKLEGRASGLANRFCQEFYEGIEGLLGQADGPEDVNVGPLKEDICRRAAAETKALEKAIGDRTGPLPVDHEITFGEHEGKTLMQIAEEDPGYVEWALEELEGRPRLRKGLARALRRA
ncbi:hypothetical protein [Salinibacter ruber]|uniref:exodeoxyribonuclease X C-terminal domain-containing protein n=1 Tax=Salinibacter ruber TaxID=146919 RepID=UPI00216A6839|nr:hypothetical protein [Salinibacter ruber]MCS3612525.1 hypothetical protein [Salinibacter ruber]MCS3648365.1 hypothetical protein [Salinibacter ruber]MCS3784767.1 hypothetical protein [Salinibacter ruber]